MGIKQLEDSLPNGFHDAGIEAISVNYVLRTATMAMDIHVGNPEGATKEERERRAHAELQFSDVLYFVVEGPDPRYKYAESKTLWVDAGSSAEPSAPNPPIPPGLLPEGVFAHWFYVNDWNSFIHIAAKEATLRWR